MGMGKRKRTKQDSLFIIPTASLARSASHEFYERVNQVLAADGFDDHVEELCEPFFVKGKGRNSIPPGTYFRMLLVGFFEGLESERAIDWRVSDSMSLRPFLGYDLEDGTPDHSTLSRTRQRYPVEVHEEVFTWILRVLTKAGLLKGKTVAVDATTLEANAAMRSLRRRDTGLEYQEYLTELAKASGIETPTRQDLAKLDKKRKKKASNKDWEHPHDPDAKVTKMKDRRTHLAHKAEHVVDLDTQAIVAVSLCDATEGDTSSLPWSLLRAEAHLEAVASDPEAARLLHDQPLAEVVTDKGYHSNETLVDLRAAGTRSYLSEPDQGRRDWEKKAEAQVATYANRRRIRGSRGQQLQRRRAELAERSFAHAYETGGMRRLHLRGRGNILKRLLIHVAACNLGLIMRQLLGAGTPRAFAARIRALQRLWAIHSAVLRVVGRICCDLRAKMNRGPRIPGDIPVGVHSWLAHHRSTAS
jgi:transposase